MFNRESANNVALQESDPVSEGSCERGSCAVLVRGAVLVREMGGADEVFKLPGMDQNYLGRYGQYLYVFSRGSAVKFSHA